MENLGETIFDAAVYTWLCAAMAAAACSPFAFFHLVIKYW